MGIPTGDGPDYIINRLRSDDDAMVRPPPRRSRGRGYSLPSCRTCSADAPGTFRWSAVALVCR